METYQNHIHRLQGQLQAVERGLDQNLADKKIVAVLQQLEAIRGSVRSLECKILLEANTPEFTARPEYCQAIAYILK